MGVVVGTIIGTTITALAAILGAIVNHRREYTRWLREQRRSAYGNLLEAFERCVDCGRDPNWSDTPEKWKGLVLLVEQARAHVVILGPDEVADASERIATVAGQVQPTLDAVSDARDAFAVSARRGLRSLS